MGFLGDIAKKVSSYIPKIELPKINLPNPVALAEKAVHVVQDTFQAATKPLVELASVIPNKAPAALKAVEQGFYNGINAAADKLGGELQSHGKVLEQAGKLLDGHLPFAKDIQALGQGAQALGHGIADAPENAVAMTSQVANRVENIGNSALGFLDQAKNFVADKANDVENAAKVGVDLLEKGATGIYNAGKDYLSGIAHAVDYKENIDKLGVGDKYKLGVGGSASVEGIKVYGQGSVEVAKNPDGSYTVSADGELGGGIYGEVGGKIGAKLNAEASATLGIGGKVEMKFKTADEAKKATEILLKQAAAAAVSNPTGPLAIAGPLVAQAIQPSSDELKFLANHVSAVELRGNVAGELAATLGIKDVAGINGSLKAKGEVTARLEFEEGKKPSVTIKQTLSGELAGSAGLRLTNGAAENSGGLPGANGKVEVTLGISQKYELPDHVDTKKLIGDPAGYLKEVAHEAVKSEEDKVTLEINGSGGVLGSGGGAKIEVEFKTNAQKLLETGFAEKALKGDFKGALSAVGSETEVDAKVTPYKTLGVSLSPSVSLMGFGVGVSLEATRTDMADQSWLQYKGNANEAAEQLKKGFEQFSPFLLQHGAPVIIRG